MFNRKTWMVISLALIVIGALGAFKILAGGDAMGINHEVPWGILIAGYVFFAVTSTGIGLVASLGSVFGIKRFQLLNKRALLASLIILLCGFGVLILELGRPLNMINYFLSPNPTAPIWWMGVLYGIYLVLLIVELSQSLKNVHSRAVSLIAFIVKIAAVSNLGAVFGMMVARPYWHGSFFPIYMIMTAIVAGSAVLSMILYLVNQKESSVQFQGESIVVALGKIYGAALFTTAVFICWKILSAFYGAAPGNILATKALLTGPLSATFWVFEVLIALVIPIILVFGSGFKPAGIFKGSILTMVGMLAMRINFVIAGQIIPLDPQAGMYNSYVPLWPEWALIFGAIGAAIFLYFLGEQKLNLTDQVSEESSVGENMRREVSINS